ncbi:MAG: glycosyltransferase family 2 protein [bacterium]
MEVSIVIPTYNKLDFLKRTLRTLSHLTYPRENLEVIVVDDGSEDGTQQFLERFSPPFDYFFFRHGTNRCLSAARNTGIRHARGEIVVFLDDDMEVVPQFLEEHLKFHAASQRAAVMGNVQLAAEVPRTGIVRYLSSRGVHKLKPGQKVPFKYWRSSNSSVRRSILIEVGLFDERIQEYGGEDLELAFRLEKLGDVNFIYAPQAISYHMHYRHLTDVCRLMFNYGQTSLAYMVQKHPELAETVKAHLKEPINFGHDSLFLIGQKLLLRAVMNPMIYTAMKWYATKSNTGSPAFIYDYIIAYNYLTGLRRSLGSRKGLLISRS